jgi:hypothetical protein
MTILIYNMESRVLHRCSSLLIEENDISYSVGETEVGSVNSGSVECGADATEGDR